VLGLKIDGGERFTRLLEESTIAIDDKDLLVLYTDGVTDATSPSDEFFGDARLAAMIGEHARLPLDALRDRVIHEIQDFAGNTAQHDDMTMVFIRIGG
jgi:serine phosphatase RsbU (regulator of sigma subunit)